MCVISRRLGLEHENDTFQPRDIARLAFQFGLSSTSSPDWNTLTYTIDGLTSDLDRILHRTSNHPHIHLSTRGSTTRPEFPHRGTHRPVQDFHICPKRCFASDTNKIYFRDTISFERSLKILSIVCGTSTRSFVVHESPSSAHKIHGSHIFME